MGTERDVKCSAGGVSLETWDNTTGCPHHGPTLLELLARGLAAHLSAARPSSIASDPRDTPADPCGTPADPCGSLVEKRCNSQSG
uniref:Uncharacterized protein n=1 Tax=Timema bartmani TaxID=61472 RepID=A0A7R9EWW6_9NEOP|nr:unnamed protein product [Timema bartmani]